MENNSSDLAAKMMVRMPEALRGRITVRAKKNRRSANSEVVLVLEREFPEPAAGGDTA